MIFALIAQPATVEPAIKDPPEFTLIQFVVKFMFLKMSNRFCKTFYLVIEDQLSTNIQRPKGWRRNI